MGGGFYDNNAILNSVDVVVEFGVELGNNEITITIYHLLTQFWPNFKVKFLTNNNNNNKNNNNDNNYNHNNNNNFLGLWLNRT